MIAPEDLVFVQDLKLVFLMIPTMFLTVRMQISQQRFQTSLLTASSFKMKKHWKRHPGKIQKSFASQKRMLSSFKIFISTPVNSSSTSVLVSYHPSKNQQGCGVSLLEDNLLPYS